MRNLFENKTLLYKVCNKSPFMKLALESIRCKIFINYRVKFIININYMQFGEKNTRHPVYT